MAKNRNKAAWEQIKNDGLEVDAKVYGETAYVGFVDKKKGFFSRFFAKHEYNSNDEAKRNSQAVARFVSRETGVPLRHTVPAERQKQKPSQTVKGAQLRHYQTMERRAAEKAKSGSPLGVLVAVVIAVAACVAAYGLFMWLVPLFT